VARVVSLSRPTSPSDSRHARFSDRPLRDVLVAVASLLVAAAVALFVVGPAQASSVSFHETTYSIHGHDLVVYGKITDTSHDGVSDVNVTIYRIVGGRERVLAHVTTSSQGLYRVALNHLSQLILHVRVSKRLHGRHYLATFGFWARPGRAYDVSAQLLHHSTIFFLPVFSY
jgi:hypothetical protein